MAAAHLSEVGLVTVNRSVVEHTLLALQEFGFHELEGLVLWLGDVDAKAAHVIRALVPHQHPVSSEDGVGYFVSGETLFELNKGLAATGLRLIAQVHSHPEDAYHSHADDTYAIVTSDGGLSLVVPHFGKAPPDPAVWAVYRLGAGEWRELSDTEARGLLKICEDK